MTNSLRFHWFLLLSWEDSRSSRVCAHPSVVCVSREHDGARPSQAYSAEERIANQLDTRQGKHRRNQTPRCPRCTRTDGTPCPRVCSTTIYRGANSKSSHEGVRRALPPTNWQIGLCPCTPAPPRLPLLFVGSEWCKIIVLQPRSYLLLDFALQRWRLGTWESGTGAFGLRSA